MDVGTASAVNVYNFQTTTQSSGQSAAVLQALTQIYTDSKSSAGTDSMSRVLTAANMAPVVNAMFAISSADAKAAGDSGALPAGALQAYASYGGVNATTASTLFSAPSPSSNSGSLQGFSSALNASATLALTAYQANLKYPSSSTTTMAAANSAPTSESDLQKIIQAAQASGTASTLNLLA